MKKKLSVLGALAAVCAVIVGGAKADATAYKSVTMAEAEEIFAQNGDYVILDVRSADEFAQGHISGAINISNEDIETVTPKELPETDKTIYVYCRSGRRSKAAAEKLCAMGYANIIDCGGILDWGGEIVAGETPNAG